MATVVDRERFRQQHPVFDGLCGSCLRVHVLHQREYGVGDLLFMF